MTRRQNHPLRLLSTEEKQELERVSRATSESAPRVARAKALLVVAEGKSYRVAAQVCGRRSGDAVSQIVAQFNQEGLAAISPRHGGGAKTQYEAPHRQKILEIVQQSPNLAIDGVSQWSLSTLQRHLRTEVSGEFTTVSTYTLWQVLREANYSWQQSRSWCATGSALRQCKSGVVKVTDPDAEVKKP